MDTIKLKDINFLELNKLSSKGKNGILYTDGTTCYKILNAKYPSEKLLKKFREMDGIKIDNVLLPNSLIMNNNELIGFTMDYIANSEELSSKYDRNYIYCPSLFKDLKNASLILRNIHNNGIVCTDLSYENILVDGYNDIYFCDMDGCSYKNNIGSSISLVLSRFIFNYKNTYLLNNENYDKLCMILSFILLIFKRELQYVKPEKYNEYADKIKTLKNLEEYIMDLQDTKRSVIPELPYLDEVIDNTDDALIRLTRKK